MCSLFYKDPIQSKPANKLSLLNDLIQLCNYDPVTGVFLFRGRQAYSLTSNGYLACFYKGKLYRVHKLIWYIMTRHYPTYPLEELDHIDGNKLNNIWSNLRLVNKSNNQRNRKKVTKFRGVSSIKYEGGFRVQFRNLNSKKICISGFSTEEEAALCWDYIQRKMGLLPVSSLNYPSNSTYELWEGAEDYIECRLNS
jgi:hypothetical protein